MRLAPATAGVLLASALAAAHAAERPLGLDQFIARADPVTVTVEPVELGAGELSGIDLRGAWRLRGDHPDFGGFSGLVLRDGMFYAVSDRGWLLGAAYSMDGAGAALGDARMAPLQGPAGHRYWKLHGGDAEGLTWTAGRLAISFERDQRVMFLGADGRMTGAIQPPGFGRFPANRGPEALATLPDGRLLVIGEGLGGGGAPVFVIGEDGSAAEGRLPLAGAHAVTGADIGPDGRLYLTRRDYSLLFGVSIRVMRFRLGPDCMPVPESGETLAAFEAESGIDNMEGIALDRAADGTLRLWLVSDDNYRASQHTLLVVFDVPD